jgi:signal transduction histidine kinase
LDHLNTFLVNLSHSLSESEPEHTASHRPTARAHGLQRWEVGWSVDEVVRDFQILRLVMIDYLEEALERPLRSREVMALGLALDEAIAASVSTYVKHLANEAAQAERHKVEKEKEIEATNLRHSAEMLARANQRKDEFLAVLGHELRNPLAPLRNALEVLRLRGDDAKTRQWIAEMVDRQVVHMTRLVDELLDASRIGQGKVRLAPQRLDLGQLVRLTGEDYRSALDAAGLEYTLDVPTEPVWVIGDRTRLAQVIGNLIQNACKFTESGGRVTVRLQTELEQGLARVTIQDTGIGIDKEALPHIFESFMQTQRGVERSRGGLGLGLALVKGLLELHGGGITAQSAGPGHGAEFTFWLPLEKAPGS